MSRRFVSVDIGEIWNSAVVVFLNRILTENWSEIGLTSEVEARLGKVLDTGFESGVNMKYFYGMKDYLLTKNYWTDKDGNRIKPEEDDEYAIVYGDDVRVVVVKEKGSFSVKEVIRKHNQEKETYFFGDEVFALRLSLAEETPLIEQEKQKYIQSSLDYVEGKGKKSSEIILVRRRQRTSFNFNNEYCLDMTATQSGNSLDELESSSPIFEVECELGIPRHSHCEQLFIFLNAILKRMMSQPDVISFPPKSSKFHPSMFQRVSMVCNNPCNISGDIELLSSEGYSDELIQWCKENNPEGKAILPMELARQIPWCLAHSPVLCTLQNDTWKTGADSSLLHNVMNNGGTIRTRDGHVFHCCIWQYEGVLLPVPTQSVKRPYSTN